MAVEASLYMMDVIRMREQRMTLWQIAECLPLTPDQILSMECLYLDLTEPDRADCPREHF